MEVMFKRNMQTFWPWRMCGFARNHVVPVIVANESEFIRVVYGVDQYQQRFNSLENVIILPTSDADAAGLGMAQHRGNHPGYRNAVARVHDGLLDEYLTRLAADPSAEAALKQEYRKLHDRIEFQLKQVGWVNPPSPRSRNVSKVLMPPCG
jgi:hypothetical protein